MTDNRNIKGVNRGYLLQTRPFQAAPNNYNDQADFDKSFAPNTVIVNPTDYKNKKNTLHNNIGDSVLKEEVYDFNILIDSRDRDMKLYPNPFDFQVSIGPALFRALQELDSNGKIDYEADDPKTKTNNQIKPVIKHDLLKIKYVSFESGIFPRAYTMVEKNMLDNNVKSSNILELENDMYLILDIKELQDPTKYATNDALSKSFAVLYDRDIANTFQNIYYGSTSKRVFKDPLDKLSTLTIKVKGSDGKVLNYPYLNYCACCDKGKCNNYCCNKEITKQDDVASNILTSSFVLSHNSVYPYFGSFDGAVFTDSSDYTDGTIEWEITGGILQPIAQPYDFQFSGTLDSKTSIITGTLTITSGLNVYSFPDTKIQFTHNEFESQISGNYIGGLPLTMTLRGTWLKSKKVSFVMYGVLSGLYIFVPFTVDLTNLATTPVNTEQIVNQTIGSFETQVPVLNTVFDSTSLVSNLQKFKACLNINVNGSFNTKTLLVVEGVFNSTKTVLGINVTGKVLDNPVNGSGNLVLTTVASKTSVTGTISIIYGTPNNTLAILVTAEQSGTEIAGTLTGTFNGTAFSWNLAMGYSSEYNSVQILIEGTLLGNPFVASSSFTLNTGAVVKEYYPEGSITGRMFISAVDTTLSGSWHHINYLPNQYVDSFVIGLFDTATEDYLFTVNGSIQSTLSMKYLKENSNIITNISVLSNFFGHTLSNQILPPTITNFSGLVSSEINFLQGTFVIVVNSPNISVIIQGTIPANMLNTGGGGLYVITGTIAGTIQDNTPTVIATFNGPITGFITGNVFMVTVENTLDGTQLNLSFSTNIPVVKDLYKLPLNNNIKAKKSCCDCRVSCRDKRLQTLINLKVGLLEPSINIKTPLLK